MKFLSKVFRYLDWFVLTLLGIMILGIIFPLPSPAVAGFRQVSHWAIVLLFFVYGAKLKTDEVVAGLKNIRLQFAILVSTFIIFPLLGVLNHLLIGGLLGTGFALGMFYTTLLPSTVQSSIGFTSIAKGNVPGAVTAATISNLAGTFLTPILVMLLLGHGAQISLTTLWDIALLILLPFAVGQVSGRFTRTWLRTHPVVTKIVDKGTIYLVVISAVSQAKLQGLWDSVRPKDFAVIAGDAVVLVGIMLVVTWFVLGGLLRLGRADRIALMMCGSKKSLATGLPMAFIIFPAEQIGHIMVPIMLLHLLQLLMCSLIASYLARQSQGSSGANK